MPVAHLRIPIGEAHSRRMAALSRWSAVTPTHLVSICTDIMLHRTIGLCQIDLFLLNGCQRNASALRHHAYRVRYRCNRREGVSQGFAIADLQKPLARGDHVDDSSVASVRTEIERERVAVGTWFQQGVPAPMRGGQGRTRFEKCGKRPLLVRSSLTRGANRIGRLGCASSTCWTADPIRGAERCPRYVFVPATFSPEGVCTIRSTIRSLSPRHATPRYGSFSTFSIFGGWKLRNFRHRPFVSSGKAVPLSNTTSNRADLPMPACGPGASIAIAGGGGWEGTPGVPPPGFDGSSTA